MREPVALAGGPAELRSYFPANHDLNILSNSTAGTPWVDPAALDTATYDAYDSVELPGLLSGECVSRDDFNYLEVTVNADPADPAPTTSPATSRPSSTSTS